MQWLRAMTAACAAWGLLVFATLGTAADKISSERRLPSQVLAYVSVRDASEFKTRFSRCNLGAMLQDESMAEFMKGVEAQQATWSDEFERQTGLSLKDVRAIPQGEFAVALFLNSDEEMSIVALLDYGEHGDTVKLLLEKASQALEDKGARRTEEEFEDAKLVQYTTKAGEAAEAGSAAHSGSIAFTMHETYLVLGAHLADLKVVLERWDGKAPNSLADNPSYTGMLNECSDEGHEPLFVWYINPMELLKAGLRASPEASLQAGLMTQFLPTLGLDKLQGLGGTFDLSTTDFDTVTRTLICIDQPATGLMQMLDFPSKHQAPSPWVTADLATYMALSWNLEKAYAAVESVFDNFQGKGALARACDQLATNPQMNGLHVKRDLIDVLSGDFQISSRYADPDDILSEKYLIAARLKDTAAFRRTLAKIINMPGFSGKSREFQGETLVEFGQTEDDEDETHPTPWGLTIAENHVMIASDVGLVEQGLRGTSRDESLEASAEYRQTSRFFPAQTSSIAFQKQVVQAQAVLALFRGKLASVFGDQSSIDFSKLPELSSMKKHLTPAGSYMQTVTRGLKIVSFSLKSDED